MPTSLFQYEMLPTTWFYLSSIMIIATFFRFNRCFSVRNLDIIGLISFTPGLLFISMGETNRGFMWLYGIGLIIFFRLFIDIFLVRRPLLEPNLAMSGLVFSCVMLIMFFIPNLLINRGNQVETPRTLRLDQLMAAQTKFDLDAGKTDPLLEIPGYRPFYLLSRKIEQVFLPSEEIQDQIRTKAKTTLTNPRVRRSFFHNAALNEEETFVEGDIEVKFGALIDVSFDNVDSAVGSPVNFESLEMADDFETADLMTGIESSAPSVENKGENNVDSYNRLHDQRNSEDDPNHIAPLDEIFLIAFIILAQLGVVLGLVSVGHCHFGNLKTGLAAAMVYLLLPYVNQLPGSLENVLPGMLLVLAVAIYRRPIFSGFLIGLAGSLVFYPFFLLPLWIGFYLKRGLHRFIIGVVSAVMIMGILLMLSSADYGTYAEQLGAMFGWHSMFLVTPTGLWDDLPTYYRIPIIALFMVICFGLSLWPTQKNLATLISCSAMIMLGVQFWMGNLGGLFMGWYLPLLILTLFRPNLEDRVAATTVIEV